MTHVVYNTTTTRLMNSKTYATAGTAKAALTRAAKNDNTMIKTDYAVTTFADHYDNIVQMVERTNALTGAKYMEREDTPFYCSPSSETYWSS